MGSRRWQHPSWTKNQCLSIWTIVLWLIRNGSKWAASITWLKYSGTAWVLLLFLGTDFSELVRIFNELSQEICFSWSWWQWHVWTNHFWDEILISLMHMSQDLKILNHIISQFLSIDLRSPNFFHLYSLRSFFLTQWLQIGSFEMQTRIETCFVLTQRELRFLLRLVWIGNNWKPRDFPTGFVTSMKKSEELTTWYPWFYRAT